MSTTEITESETPAQAEQAIEESATSTETLETEVKEEVKGEESAAEPFDDVLEEKKTARGVQKRLDELTREKYEWKRESEYWREQAKAKINAEPKASQPEEKSISQDDKPKPDTYDDYNEYVEALTDWKVKNLQAEQTKKMQEDRRLTEHRTVQEKFNKSIELAKSKYSDFDTTIRASASTPCTQDMMSAIMDSPDGAEVMYFLARNPQDAERISGLSPMSQIREIGKLENRITSIKPPEPKRITTSNEPVKTVSGAGISERDPNKMDMTEYASWRLSKTG